MSPDALSQAGEDVFRVQCASCHTVDGYNGIRFAVRGWSWTMIDYELAHVHQLKGFMPPFVGTEPERKALGFWLGSLNPAPAQVEISPVAKSQQMGSASGEGRFHESRHSCASSGTLARAVVVACSFCWCSPSSCTWSR